MKLTSIISAFVAATAIAAPTPGAYTDPKSGISFSGFTDTASGYFFGIALPPTPGTEFIATIGGKGTGWSGVSLGGGMLNKLLIVAWPNGAKIVSSFRKTASYGSPPLFTTPTTQFHPIANGTYTNATHWTYTFLCTGCILSDGTTFAAADTTPSFGYALNPAAPDQKGTPGAPVKKHTAQGQVKVDLSKAKSEKYALWKSWAGNLTASGF
ncbi:iron reductase domain protein [Periconia macrospinosa]|uniref:Iron reductase domain protein n=1 Tax=Periconia macrospinosa TaxID=97972 RepID=A0A2V1DQG2_9PLEO|nr:iron reductase domain protein [Periconia macrospinosa]